VQHPPQVDVDHRRPSVDVEVRQRPDPADAGIAHQDVESAELVGGRGDQPLEVFAVRDIGFAGDRGPAAIAYLSRDLVEKLDASRAQDHAGAALGEQKSSRRPDPTACAGDGHDLPVDPRHRATATQGRFANRRQA
jgi:hypothetical protein